MSFIHAGSFNSPFYTSAPVFALPVDDIGGPMEGPIGEILITGNPENNNINAISSVVIDEKELEKISDNNCSVCLENWKVGDIIKILNCSHIFHENCINEWIVRSADQLCPLSCPLCRNPI